jgi:hypothetical protein
MDNPFDPQSEYKLPKGDSKYLKFEKGVQTEFLPLASAAVGYEYWDNLGKPVRLTEKPDQLPDNIRVGADGKPEPIKHFWAFPVFDFNDRKVKVLEITQKTIMSAILSYSRNPKWGNPVLAYSFTVNRTGDGFETEYTTMANPKEEVSPDIHDAWAATKAAGFDITRLFNSGDPFTSAEL